MTTFLYFAYGSNMLVRRLSERTPSASAMGNGYVVGHRLAFHKPSKDGSGKCNIVATGVKSDTVYGVLYCIKVSERVFLDKAEGIGRGYETRNIEVNKIDGSKVDASTYVATVINHTILPYHWYKALIIAGAEENGLPDSYIELIRSIRSKEDPNQERRNRNMALLIS